MKMLIEMVAKGLLDTGGVWLLAGVIFGIALLLILAFIGLMVPLFLIRVNKRLDQILQILAGPSGLYHLIYSRYGRKARGGEEISGLPC